MKKISLLLGLLIPAISFAQSTSFIYQGRLNDNGAPANGIYDLRFAIYDAGTNGNQIGDVLTNAATSVSNGLFSVSLDFGNVFDGSDRWLEIGVRTNGSASDFSTLAPRQEITSTPYAIQALNAASAMVASNADSVLAQNISGAISTAQLPATVLTNDASGVSISGTFNGNGNGLTNLNASQVSSGTIPDAQLSANVALLNGTNQFSGSNNFSGVTIATNANNRLAGTFSGNGSGLTDLNASQISSGTISAAQLPTIVLTNGASGVSISGTFSGNGGSLTNISLSAIGPAGALAYNLNFPLASIFTASSVGDSLPSVCSLDANNDGKPDLIGLNTQNSDIMIWTNAGNGTFSLSETLGIGGGATSGQVLATDVNGDGKQDIVCMANVTGNITVFTNNGAGGFSQSCVVFGDYNENSIAAANLFGNGRVDLVVCSTSQFDSQGDYGLTFLKNNGNGVFSFGGNKTITQNTSTCIATADVNGDGKQDIIVSGYGSGYAGVLTILTNDGVGHFTISSLVNVDKWPVCVVAADVNGDGKADLLDASYNGGNLGSVDVLTNDGAGNFRSAPTVIAGRGCHWVTVADMNGDGRPDLAVVNLNDNNAEVFANDGQANFTLAGRAGTGPGPNQILATDVNADNRPDLICDCFGLSQIYTLTNYPTLNVGMPIAGDGGALTNLNASQISSGTISTAQLPTTVLTNGASGVSISGTLNGNGNGLTNLNASEISSGTISPARLPSSVVTNTETGVILGGTFSGNGSSLANLNAVSLGGTELITNGNGIVLNTSFNANSHPIYLKSAGDVNHGLAASGAVTNFTSLNPPDGPILWGYDGGALGSMNIGAKLPLVWTTSGVTVSGNLTNSGNVIVSGDVRVNGTNYAVSSAENLRIVRGEITSNGTIDFGSNFSVTHPGTGDYIITYTPAFANYAAVTATSYGSILIPTIYSNNPNSVELKFYNTSGNLADPTGFDFTAIGP